MAFMNPKPIYMLIKYQRFFGILRIISGVIFIIYPVQNYLNMEETSSEDDLRSFFVMLFFAIYAISAIRNGILELSRKMPLFNLFRFFESAMNGFVSVYLFIILFTAELNAYAKFLIFILASVLLLSMIRDTRLISVQYYDKRKKAHEKRNS
jgi:hypothetical protein